MPRNIGCWVEGNTTRMLIAEYNNLGSEWFYRRHASLEDSPLKSGDNISGSIELKLG